jgi:hypothetical protein
MKRRLAGSTTIFTSRKISCGARRNASPPRPRPRRLHHPRATGRAGRRRPRRITAAGSPSASNGRKGFIWVSGFGARCRYVFIMYTVRCLHAEGCDLCFRGLTPSGCGGSAGRSHCGENPVLMLRGASSRSRHRRDVLDGWTFEAVAALPLLSQLPVAWTSRGLSSLPTTLPLFSAFNALRACLPFLRPFLPYRCQPPSACSRTPRPSSCTSSLTRCFITFST